MSIYSFFRATLAQVQAAWSGGAGYAAAKWDRFTKARPWNTTTSENAISPDQYGRVNSDAWRLYRDNPYIRKIVRSITSKVVGNGMTPRSSAMISTREGDVPATAFRLRAQQLWREQSPAIDFTGKPCMGGETQAGLERLALISCILSGDALFTLRSLTSQEQRDRRLPAPIAVQLIDSRRLSDDMVTGDISSDHYLHRGIEFDADMRRFAYWLYGTVPGAYRFGEKSALPRPHDAGSIYHVFIKDDIDQVRGTSWLAPAILQGRDTNDLQYNVLKASAMSACVVGGYSLGQGRTKFGQTGSSSDDATDSNGNTINRLSPGMLLNLGKDGDFKFFSPSINLAGNEQFIQHLLRGIAGAMPGTKSSTVTGDYRNSSFSSERSADNDCWPEIECIQQWFASVFCQPIYEAVVSAAVADGYFDGIVAGSEFAANKANYLRCDWQGPVARSINPVDDVSAAALRIKSGISTPQIEAAKVGLRTEDIINAVADFAKQAEQAGLPEIYVNNVLGFDTKDVLSTAETQAAVANGGANVPKD